MSEVVHRFEDLRCYQAAREVRLKVSEFCRTLPCCERYRLVDQILRSSRSVTANIAEGYGRHHHQENLQYLRQARASLYETLEHFHTAFDEQFLELEAHDRREQEIITAIRILNGYIRYIAGCTQRDK